MKVCKDKKSFIENLLAEKNGVLRTGDVIAAGICKEGFYKLAEEMGLERAAHGIFIAQGEWTDDLCLLQTQIPKAVFSHETALYLHNLAESEPMPLTVTIPAKYNNPRLAEKGVRTVFVKNEWYGLGICEMPSLSGHSVVVYDMERTICDIIRRRSEMDISAFNYAVREYVRRNDKNLDRLSEYSKLMRMEKRVWDTMGVLL